MTSSRRWVALWSAAGLVCASWALAQDAPNINAELGPMAVSDCEAGAWAIHDLAPGETLPPEARRLLYACVGEAERLGGANGCPEYSDVLTPALGIRIHYGYQCGQLVNCHCSVTKILICDDPAAMGRDCTEVGPPPRSSLTSSGSGTTA